MENSPNDITYDRNSPIRLKVITNRKLCEGQDLVYRLRRVIDDYMDCKYLEGYILDSIILREKDMDQSDYIKLYQNIYDLVDRFNRDKRLVVNNLPRIGLYSHYFMEKSVENGIKNIHLPLHILKNNKKLVDKFDSIGVSCHSLEEAREARELGASYITFSHIFITDCKKGLEPRGLDELNYVVKNIDIPVYALGGINHTNARECIDSGASGVVMMSNIMKNKI